MLLLLLLALILNRILLISFLIYSFFVFVILLVFNMNNYIPAVDKKQRIEFEQKK